LKGKVTLGRPPGPATRIKTTSLSFYLMFVKKKTMPGKLLLSAVGDNSGEKSPLASALERTATRLLNIEREAREAATEIQLGREAFVCDISSKLAAVENTSDFKWIREVLQSVARAQEAAYIAAVAVCGDYAWSFASARAEGRKPNLNPGISVGTEEALKELDQAVREVTGRSCRYAVSNTVASALNDIAACVHRLAEYLLSQSSGPERVGKCDVLRGSSRQAVDLCARWSMATEELKRRRLYQWDDYSALWGYTLDNEVYLKVGSAEGHRTHIDLNQGTLRYYDNDGAVNRVMARLLSEEAGLSCEVLDDGVACTGVDPENADRAAAALAFATSMDFRLKWPEDYWRDLYGEAEGETPEDVELNLAKRTLREVLRKIASAPRELAHTVLAVAASR